MPSLASRICRALTGERKKAVAEEPLSKAAAEAILSGAPTSGLFFARADPPCHRFINLDNSSPVHLSLGFLGGSGIMVLASYNGLLLCGRESSGVIREFLVCDPTTQEFVSVPLPTRFFGDPADMCAALVSASPRSGWIPLSVNDLHGSIPQFKVVLFRLASAPASPITEWAHYSFEIYSSETREWQPVKKTGGDISARRDTRHTGGVLYRRAVHWMGKFGKDAHIVAFDLVKLTARKIQVPANGSKRSMDWFGECDGALHIVRVADTKLEIWKISDYLNVDWVLEHRSDFSCQFRPVGYDGGRVLLIPAAGNKIVRFSHHVDCPTFDVVFRADTGGRETENRPYQPWFVPYRLGKAADDEWLVVEEPDYCAEN